MPERVSPERPTPDRRPLPRGLLTELAKIVGPENVVSHDNELLVYECDGYTIERVSPDAVVLPGNTEEVSRVVALLHRHHVPFIPRGAGTSLSGGTLAVQGGVMICLSRMKRVLEVDLRNRRAVVEAGVVNAWVTQKVAPYGYQYAPDPSSQGSCTIGGNVGTNSGGPHTLKYGVTVNHVLGLKVVLPDGRIVQLGGGSEEQPGYDLTAFFVGSEGTLGLATEITLRLIRLPQGVRTLLAVFETVADASHTVSEIIESGIVPGALEMMDNLIIQAVEDAFGFGFPRDAGAVLIIELEGLEVGLEEQARAVRAICGRNKAREVREAADPDSRTKLWASRKKAFGAVGRLAPSYVTQDGVVPRTKLPEILDRITQIGKKYDLRIANVFHAGDGNIHPLLLFDERDPDQVQRVLAASDEILSACLDLGGSVTGEHGIGIEKVSHLSRMFSPEDLQVMVELRSVFNPLDLCNPGKVFPTSRGCVEVKRPRPSAPA